MSDAPWTIQRVLVWIASRLSQQGVPSSRLDAELLVSAALGVSRLELYTHFDKPLSASELAQVRESVRRRLAGEPVAYITGAREFWSLPLQVDRRVLIPRPETEHLVEVGLELLGERAQIDSADAWRPDGPIVDVGTGSGAVALALKKERPERRVVAVDRSDEALAVARANADRLGLAIELRAGDLLDPVRDLAPLALIVANLPYVPSGDAGRLPFARFEPHAALFAGASGLEAIERLIAMAPPLLAPGGAIALEVGEGQAEAVRGLLRSAGLNEIAARRDLAGVERIVHGVRAP